MASCSLASRKEGMEFDVPCLLKVKRMNERRLQFLFGGIRRQVQPKPFAQGTDSDTLLRGNSCN